MKILQVAMVGLGFLVLGYLVGQLGFDEVLHQLDAIKWVFPILLIPSLVWNISNTIAWSFAFPPDAFKPRLLTLFAAKLAGETVNQLTPFANLGGEPVKAYLLSHRTPGPRGMASVVVDKTAQLVVGLSFTILGLGLLFYYHDVSELIPLEYRVLFTSLLVASPMALWLFYKRQDRMFTSLLKFLRSTGISTDLIERNMGRAARIDTNIGSFYREHRTRFLQALFFQSVGWFMGTCETYFILNALDAGVGFWFCFLLNSLGAVINGLFFFMPSNIGVMEGSLVFLFSSLGLDPALGLSLGLTRRLRRVVWIFIGWTCLSYMSRNAIKHGASEHTEALQEQSDPPRTEP